MQTQATIIITGLYQRPSMSDDILLCTPLRRTRRIKLVLLTRLMKKLDNGGYEALMHFLKTFDISKYDLSVRMDTEALRDQKIKTATADKGPRGWLINFLHEGQLPFIGVVDCNDETVAPAVRKDDSGNVVFNANGVITYDDADLVRNCIMFRVSLRQTYAKSIIKLDEVEPRAFGLNFSSFFPELDDCGKIIMINNMRRVKNVLDEGKSKGSARERVKYVYNSEIVSMLRRKMMNAVGWVRNRLG